MYLGDFKPVSTWLKLYYNNVCTYIVIPNAEHYLYLDQFINQVEHGHLLRLAFKQKVLKNIYSNKLKQEQRLQVLIASLVLSFYIYIF